MKIYPVIFLALSLSLSASADIKTVHYIIGSPAQIAKQAKEIQKSWCTELNENLSEINFNGVDDDDNGFVDDVFGWDFIESRPLQKASFDSLFVRKMPSDLEYVTDPRVHGCSKAVPVVASAESSSLSRAASYPFKHKLFSVLLDEVVNGQSQGAMIRIYFPKSHAIEKAIYDYWISRRLPAGMFLVLVPYSP